MTGKTFISRYNLDIPLLLTTIALIVIGIIFIYSASSNTDTESIFSQTYIKQILAVIPGGLMFAFILFFVNYQDLSNTLFVILFYFTAILLLVLILFLGVEINGSKSWFDFGIFNAQPSEFTKILFIFVLAKYLNSIGRKIQTVRHFLVSLLIPLSVIGLIMLQPDLGTALVYIPITLAILFMGGAKIEHLIVVICIGLIVLGFGLYTNYTIYESSEFIRQDKISKMIEEQPIYNLVLEKEDIDFLSKTKLNEFSDKTIVRTEYNKKADYLKDQFVLFTLKIALPCLALTLLGFFLNKFFKSTVIRVPVIIFFILAVGLGASTVPQKKLKPHHAIRFFSFLNPEVDPKGSSYNQRQSIIAIGSGGPFGHGIKKGPQNQLNYIPEKTTDFIFAVIGEEWGFFGTFIVCGLFSILIYRGLIIAFNSKDYFGTLVATGITTLFFFHVSINLAMAVGMSPVMGIPLPFLSAGGSSLITSMTGVAVLLNIAQRRYVN